MKLEDTIASIVDKAQLHAWIDDLPEGSCAVILAELPDGVNAFNTFGEINRGKALWLSKTFEHFIVTEDME